MTDKAQEREISGDFLEDRYVRFALPRFEQTFIRAVFDGLIPRQTPDRTRIDDHARHVVCRQ